MSRVLLSSVGTTYAVDGAVLVEEADLSLHAGEVVALVGPNGAGKTTLLRLLAGDLTPGHGEVRIDGRRLASVRPRDLARLRAMLPHHTVLQFAFRVLDVVMMGRYPHREATRSEDEAAVASAMAAADVGFLAERLFTTLSGGEQARSSLARVLAQETPVVLLDEPSASLDIRHQELVMGVLRGLAAGGAGVLTVLHDLNLAARHADRVGVMDRARLVEVGPTAEVLRADLLSAVYGHPVAVVPHPYADCPLVLPLSP